MFTSLPPPGSISLESLAMWAGEQFNELERVLKCVGKREPYNVTWSAPTTQPAIGNGTLKGEFVELGSFMVVAIHLSVGSTTTFGTGGGWSFSIPRAPINTGVRWIGSGWARDATGNLYTLAVRTAPPAAAIAASIDNGLDVTGTTPFAWASGDELVLTVGYPLE